MECDNMGKICPNCDKFHTDISYKCVDCGTWLKKDKTGRVDRFFNDNLKKNNEALKKLREEHPEQAPPPPTPSPRNSPKCPTCGSYNVEPLSTTRKVGGLLTVGLASKTIGKSYRCKNCKYYW